MSGGDAKDYDKLKKALLTRYNFTEDGYRKRFKEINPQTEETPDQFVIRLKDAIVDLIVKEQFINACSEELDVYLLER